MDRSQITQGRGTAWREADDPEGSGSCGRALHREGGYLWGLEVVRQSRGPGGSWSPQISRWERSRSGLELW